MRYRPLTRVILPNLILLTAAACSRAAAVSEISDPTPSQTKPRPATATQREIYFTPTNPLPEKSPPATPGATASLPAPATPTATPCPPELCVYPGWFVLSRPITPPGRDAIDRSYPFGSTQNGQRDPHHGVEFLNGSGTPVLAAAAGEVVVAGDDRQAKYGPYFNFYGNLVVIRHDLPEIGQPLYTLYGHLSEVLAATGERVQRGDKIGLVGMSGAATGSHLHFEVRLGANTYQAARNPELWLAPLLAQSGQPRGAIAGRLVTPPGIRLQIPSIVVERLTGGREATPNYAEIYAEPALWGQEPWRESFAIADLPAGMYRLSFIQFGLNQREVPVYPGQLTVVTFRLGFQE